MKEKIKVLFLCTGNSCRSQMAEGWTRHLKDGEIEAYSAGTEPTTINQQAVQVMAEAGVDISKQKSKHIDSFRNTDFDYVITVCGHAQENCPVFPGNTMKIHKGFDDPPKLAENAKTEEDALGHFRRVRDQIKVFVETLPKTFMEVTKMENEKKKKRGLFSAIKDSMRKTGGCCGPGETCGGPAKRKDKDEGDGKDAKGSVPPKDSAQ